MTRERRTDITRRGVLGAGAAGVAGALGIGTVSARRLTDDAGAPGYEVERIPAADVAPEDTDVVQPVPEPAGDVRPGSVLVSDNGGGTAGFVWREVDEEKPDEELDLYLSTAGALLLDEANASENATREGEAGESVEDVTVVVDVDGTFGGAGAEAGALQTVELGEVVYARQATPLNESGFGDSFGLVRIPEELHDSVDPSVPQFGGPDGLVPNAPGQGTVVHLYGNSVHGETFATKGRTGNSLGGLDAGTWAAAMRFDARGPGPGDYGAPLVTSDTADGLPRGDAAAGVATHRIIVSGAEDVTIGGGGTIMGKCMDLVERDIDLEIELVQPGDL